MRPFRVIDPPAGRIYAIGDIHGCLREISAVIEFLKKERKLSAEDLVVFMGDYIDRGRDTRGVISLLIDFQKEYSQTVFLRGNHEDMFLNFLGFEGSQGAVFLVNGGAATLKSYGISSSTPPAEIVNDMPNAHLAFLLGLDSYVQVGEYVFAHAGIHPLKPLEEQSGMDLFWIRDEFIANIHRFPVTVVFGHTPYQQVLFNPPFKIGIDTGLVYHNVLTCLDLTNKEIIQVRFGTDRVVTGDFPEFPVPV